MSRTLFISSARLLLAAVLFFSSTAITVAAETPAVVLARQYVELLDSGDFGGAWAQIDLYTQRLLDQDDWLQQQAVVREAYGPVLQREVQSFSQRSSLALHPDGCYLFVSFASRFADKAAVTETVALRQEADSSLAVVGYRIN